MSRWLLVCLFGLCMPAFAQDAATTDVPPTQQRLRVLVLDLQVSGVDSEQAKLIDELLTVEISKKPGIDVISGADVRRMTELEAEKQTFGCEDSSCLAEIAGAMGARYVVYGRVGKLGERLILTLNLFDSESAAAIGRAELSPASIDVIPDELPGAVERLTASLAPAAGGVSTSTDAAAPSDAVAAAPSDAPDNRASQNKAAEPGAMAIVWPVAFASAGVVVVAAGLGFDLLSPSSDDGTLDALDLIGPTVIAVGIGAALFGVFVNPFAEGSDA